MMGPLHRPLAAAASSAAAVLAATVAADLVEALMDGPGASSAGRAAAWTVPAGLVLSLLVRALWRGWRPLAPARAANDPASRASGAEARDPAAGREARARALGGLFAGALAVLLVGAAGWSGAVAAGSLTHVPRLAALTVGLFAVAGGAVAALVFVPAARAAASLALARERRGLWRGAGALAAALALLFWLALLVRAGGADRGRAGVAPYLSTFLVALVAAHAAGARLGRALSRRRTSRGGAPRSRRPWRSRRKPRRTGWRRRIRPGRPRA